MQSSEGHDENDPGETTSNGQPLVKVIKRRGRPPNSARAPAPPVPPAAPVSPTGTTTLYTQFDEVPPDVDDPAYRDGPTIGSIRLTPAAEGAPEVPDLSDDRLRTLEDIYVRFPVGDSTGQYFVHVERKSPRAYQGVACFGVMRRMRQALTFEQFCHVYGGGEYQLTVYGPPKRGNTFDENGLPRPKALTEPIRMTIPWAADGGYPPNLDAATQQEDDLMNRVPVDISEMVRGARGAHSPATAKIFETDKVFEERAALRDREDRERRDRQQRAADATSLEILERARQDDRQRYDTEIAELKRELRESKKGGGDIESISRLLQVTNAQRSSVEEVATLKDQHARETERMILQHKSEITDLQSKWSQERAEDKAQRRLIEDRCDQRVKMVEETQQRRVTELEAKVEAERVRSSQERDAVESRLRSEHSREIASMKADYERRIETDRAQHQRDIESERRQNERDLAMRKEVGESQLKSEVNGLNMKIETIQRENKRLENEVLRWRTEAEKKPSLNKQIQEIEQSAAALGLVRSDEVASNAEPKDWKSSLVEIGTEAVKHLPQILKSAGEVATSVKAARAPAPPPMGDFQQQYMPQPMRQVTQAPPMQMFQSEYSAGVDRPPPPDTAFAQTYSTPVMPPVMQAAPQYQPPGPEVAMVPANQVTPPQQMMSQPPPAMAQPAPTQVAQYAATPSQPPPAPPRLDSALEQELAQGIPMLQGAYEGGMAAADVAKQILENAGPVKARVIHDIVSPDIVSNFLNSQGQSSSPFVRRSGQKYLREIREALAQLIGKAAAA